MRRNKPVKGTRVTRKTNQKKSNATSNFFWLGARSPSNTADRRVYGKIPEMIKKKKVKVTQISEQSDTEKEKQNKQINEAQCCLLRGHVMRWRGGWVETRVCPFQ